MFDFSSNIFFAYISTFYIFVNIYYFCFLLHFCYINLYFIQSIDWVKPNKTNLQNIKKNPKLSSRVLFLNIDSATTYLPRRLPSEYCRREKSLRPCSGWERVVSFCLVTEKPLCFLLSKLISESIALRTGSCIMNALAGVKNDLR